MNDPDSDAVPSTRRAHRHEIPGTRIGAGHVRGLVLLVGIGAAVGLGTAGIAQAETTGSESANTAPSEGPASVSGRPMVRHTNSTLRPDSADGTTVVTGPAPDRFPLTPDSAVNSKRDSHPSPMTATSAPPKSAQLPTSAAAIGRVNAGTVPITRQTPITPTSHPAGRVLPTVAALPSIASGSPSPSGAATIQPPRMSSPIQSLSGAVTTDALSSTAAKPGEVLAGLLSLVSREIESLLSGFNLSTGISQATSTSWSYRRWRPTLPTLSIADARIPEGNAGINDMTFAVTLSAASATPITVRYVTSNGTATAGKDYAAQSGTITFAAGQSSQTIRIGVLGDTTVEPTETFTLTLSRPVGATLARAVATGTIVNDDTASPPPITDSRWASAFFAPYVQMSGWPVPNLIEMSRTAGNSLFIASFIQADGNGLPSWGGRAALETNSTNSQAQAIKGSIADFKQNGGDLMISFGGADGTSLSQYYAAHNLSAQALADAYGSVATAYGVNHLDFDIEGRALSDTAAVGLQAKALALLQQSHPDIKIWLTLPVLPTGFLPDGTNAVQAALAAGVDIAGINIMAMDYGESAAPTTGPNAKTMGAYAVEAAQSAYAQLTTLYSKYGRAFSWGQLGITPIIGVNDITSEVFTLADARTLEAFAVAKGIGMLSMWALERDTPGALGQAVWNASGVSDPAGSFTDIFNDYGAAALV